MKALYVKLLNNSELFIPLHHIVMERQHQPDVTYIHYMSARIKLDYSAWINIAQLNASRDNNKFIGVSEIL